MDARTPILAFELWELDEIVGTVLALVAPPNALARLQVGVIDRYQLGTGMTGRLFGMNRTDEAGSH
jgi:hypothetical protein